MKYFGFYFLIVMSIIFCNSVIAQNKPVDYDKTAIGPFEHYCDGYGNPGAVGLGYVSVLKVSTGVVKKTDDILVDGIVAYDRAEANDAYIGQINMETASSFCGLTGQIWGYDIAVASEIKNNTHKPLYEVEQYDGSMLPVYDAKPLLDAGIALFGTEKERRFPPAPGAHVICANKSVTVFRPESGTPNPEKNEAYGVWCYIAISIARDRETSACLFVEDAGLWTENDDNNDLVKFLDEHTRSVVWSVVACGEDQSVLYDRTYIGYSYVIMDPGYIGTAITVAPYIVLAKDAVPDEGFDKLKTMTIEEWERINNF